MKKYLFFNFLLVLILLLMAAACKSTQPINNIFHEKELNKDSIFQSKLIEKNRAIIDSLTLELGKPRTGNANCDSLCNIALQDILSRLNIKKSSGINSYAIRYDKASNTLFIDAKVGETQTVIEKQYFNITKTKTITITREIPVDKPLAKWQLILQLIGAVTVGYFSIKLFTFIKPKV